MYDEIAQHWHHTRGKRKVSVDYCVIIWWGGIQHHKLVYADISIIALDEHTLIYWT